MHSPQRMVLGAVRTPDGRRQAHQIGEVCFIARVQNPLFRTYSKDNLLPTLEIRWVMGNSSLGKIQTVQPERNQRGRENHGLALRQNGMHAIDSAKRSC